MSATTRADIRAEPAGRVGFWRALLRGLPVFAPVVVLDAAVQALLVLDDPTPAASWGFGALVIASLSAVLVAVWLTTGAAVAAADGLTGLAVIRACPRHPAVLAWASGIGLVAAAASLVMLWLAPVVLVLGSLVLPPAARGRRRVLVATVREIRAAPVRAVLSLVATLALVAISWVVALLLGVFVTGAAAAMITWLWFGIAATGSLCLAGGVVSPERGPGGSSGP